MRQRLQEQVLIWTCLLSWGALGTSIGGGVLLKLIALSTMIVDHVGLVLYPDVIWYRLIGRLSFPIFAYLVATGCRHTRDIKRYITRLFILAVVSQFPYSLAFYPGENPLYRLNVFFTLAFSAWLIAEQYWKKSLLLLLMVLTIDYLFSLNYGIFGVALIGVFYRLVSEQYRQYRPLWIISLLLLMAWYVTQYPLQLFAFAALPLLLIRWRWSFNARWLYAVYPAHLLLLAIVR